MSGGSWDYLYGQEFSPRSKTVWDMAKRAREIGSEPAARRLEELAQQMRVAENLFDLARDIMHGVEWVDSHDWSADQLIEKFKELK